MEPINHVIAFRRLQALAFYAREQARVALCGRMAEAGLANLERHRRLLDRPRAMVAIERKHSLASLRSARLAIADATHTGPEAFQRKPGWHMPEPLPAYQSHPSPLPLPCPWPAYLILVRHNHGSTAKHWRKPDKRATQGFAHRLLRGIAS